MAPRVGWGLVLVAALGLVGCGSPPQLAGKNRRLLESLKTAVMARNTAWLEKNETLIETRHQEGALSDTEHAALRSIVEAARHDDWSTAQDEVMRLAKAQAGAP